MDVQIPRPVPVVAVTANAPQGDCEGYLGAALDRGALLDRLAGDTELLHEIVDLYLAEAPRLLATVRDAFDQGDARALERAAHSLKGTLSNLAAVEATAAAKRLETLGRSRDLTGAAAVFAGLVEKLGRFEEALSALRQQGGCVNPRKATHASPPRSIQSASHSGSSSARGAASRVSEDGR